MDQQKGYNIYHNLTIKSSANQLFEAITTPEGLINWWPLKCSGEPEEGAEYRFYFGPEYDWNAEVVTCKPDHYFRLKMTKSDPDWDASHLEFTLDQKEDEVMLKFAHRNWPEDNDHFKHSSYCWALLLNGLKNYVEKGIVIPFENRN